MDGGFLFSGSVTVWVLDWILKRRFSGYLLLCVFFIQALA